MMHTKFVKHSWKVNIHIEHLKLLLLVIVVMHGSFRDRPFKGHPMDLLVA